MNGLGGNILPSENFLANCFFLFQSGTPIPNAFSKATRDRNNARNMPKRINPNINLRPPFAHSAKGRLFIGFYEGLTNKELS
jgi:hypothetical protein